MSADKRWIQALENRRETLRDQSFGLERTFHFHRNNEMNGLPANIDLSPLIGARLSQICVGRHECIFNFDTNARLSAENDCVYSRRHGNDIAISSYGEHASELCELLGVGADGAERTADGGLLLHFENGATLRFTVEIGQYESFQIQVGDSTYIA